MRVAIVGFPFSGKSSLFRAISGLPASHLKPTGENLAAVHVPEPRLDFLEQLYKPKKRTEATMEFVDLPGSAEGDVEHAGLEKHIPTLRQCDMLILVLRGFASAAVPAHDERVDPQADLNELRQEMLLADFAICAGRIDKLEKGAKTTKDRDLQRHELDMLKRCQEALENEKPLSTVIRPGDDEKMVRSFGFITQKPIMTIINVGEDQIGQEAPFHDDHACATLALCATLEADLVQMAPADRPSFMAEFGVKALARDRVIRQCADAMGIIFMLTAGPDEVRAWPQPRGSTAVEAAARIHTDLARGFIKAETIAFDDLYKIGNPRDAKAAGKFRLEPKGYIVQDGDIVVIKFNV
jgi:ribosome-binding ATPase